MLTTIIPFVVCFKIPSVCARCSLDCYKVFKQIPFVYKTCLRNKKLAATETTGHISKKAEFVLAERLNCVTKLIAYLPAHRGDHYLGKSGA